MQLVQKGQLGVALDFALLLQNYQKYVGSGLASLFVWIRCSSCLRNQRGSKRSCCNPNCPKAAASHLRTARTLRSEPQFLANHATAWKQWPWV